MGLNGYARVKSTKFGALAPGVSNSILVLPGGVERAGTSAKAAQPRYPPVGHFKHRALLAGATAWPPCAMGRKLLSAARPGVAGNSPPLY